MVVRPSGIFVGEGSKHPPSRPSAAWEGPLEQTVSFLRYFAALKPTNMQQEMICGHWRRSSSLPEPWESCFWGEQLLVLLRLVRAPRADRSRRGPHLLEPSTVDRDLTWSSITKFCALFFLVLGCYGTRSVRDGKPSKRQILLLALAGFFLLFGNDPLRSLPAGLEFRFWSYVLTLLGGYLALLTAGVWVRRLLHTTLARVPFNDDNESFEQEARPARKRILGQPSDSLLLPGRVAAGDD